MRTWRSSSDEKLLRSHFEELGAGVEPPAESELRAAARLASSEPRQPQDRPAAIRRPWRPLRLRWAIAGAALLLVATALGFGFGTWLTPSGSARGDVLGLGFLPAEGWTVVQSGNADSTEARAVAANVPLDPADAARAEPFATLRALPPGGVFIFATLTTRGDPRIDAAFPIRRLPLDLAAATRLSPERYLLRAGVGGYNLDARITFGSQPTASMLIAADDQIERLVVAGDQVTIAVRPIISAARQPVTAYGSVASGRAGVKVTLQFKQCGLYPLQFRDVAEVPTTSGGGWSLETGPETNGVYRALAGDEVSGEVQVKRRADVRLSPRRSGGRYVAYVVERLSYWRKRVVIQRFDRRRRMWLKVKTLVLEHASAAPGAIYVWSETDDFTLNLPKGTNVRAVLPADQAKPCHIAGYSNLLRR